MGHRCLKSAPAETVAAFLVTGEANYDEGFRQRSTITHIDDNPFGIELEELTEQETEEDEKPEQSADGYENVLLRNARKGAHRNGR